MNIDDKDHFAKCMFFLTKARLQILISILIAYFHQDYHWILEMSPISLLTCMFFVFLLSDQSGCLHF